MGLIDRLKKSILSPFVFMRRMNYQKSILPFRAHQDDAGSDLFSVEEVTLEPWSQAVVHTGVQLVDMPKELCMQIWPKSGLDAKLGLHVGAGIVDSGYRGEILVLCKNMSDNRIVIQAGSPVAQAVFVVCATPRILEASDTYVSETARGASGGIAKLVGEKQ